MICSFLFVSYDFRIYHCFLYIVNMKIILLLQQLYSFFSWEDPLEKEMATHSSILAWKILWTEEPDGLQYMGSQKVGHN